MKCWTRWFLMHWGGAGESRLGRTSISMRCMLISVWQMVLKQCHSPSSKPMVSSDVRCYTTNAYVQMLPGERVHHVKTDFSYNNYNSYCKLMVKQASGDLTEEETHSIGGGRHCIIPSMFSSMLHIKRIKRMCEMVATTSMSSSPTISWRSRLNTTNTKTIS